MGQISAINGLLFYGGRTINAHWFMMLAGQAMTTSPWPDPRFPPSAYYRFLRILAQNMQPSLSVELGVCGGGGSFHLAMGYDKGQVVGVDIANDHQDNLAYILSKCGNFHFLVEDSIKTAPEIFNRWGLVDILFIDTVHTYDQTIKEFEAYEPYLSDKAVVCLDDLFRPGMLDAWDYLPGNKLRLDMLHDGAENGGGFGVIWM